MNPTVQETAPQNTDTSCCTASSVTPMALPRGMETFSLPRLPDTIQDSQREKVVTLLKELSHAITHPTDLGLLDVGVLETGVQALLNDALGQGEVCAQITGPARTLIQETAFAGVWRLIMLDAQGNRLQDVVEIGEIPRIVPHTVLTTATLPPENLPCAGDIPEELMNIPGILAELKAAAQDHEPGKPAHVLNLSLLPVTYDGLMWLGATLGDGPCTILSRGYGNCRISSTCMSNVWWVQYFNSEDNLILNTIEVTDVPDAAKAAPQDLKDSAERLLEWAQIMSESQG